MKNSKTKKQRILNAEQIKVILERFGREIPRQYPSLEPVVFIGIRTRGPHIAKRVAEIMKKRKEEKFRSARWMSHCIATTSMPCSPAAPSITRAFHSISPTR